MRKQTEFVESWPRTNATLRERPLAAVRRRPGMSGPSRSDELLEKAPVGGVFLAEALFHPEHQFGSGKRNGDAIDHFRFDPAHGIFVADATRFRHQVDRDVVVYPDHHPLGDIFVAQFADGAVGQHFQRPLDQRLVDQIAGDKQVDIFGGSHEAEAVNRESADDHIGDTEAVEFACERNQIGIGRNPGYFPRRIRLAVHVEQASLVANRNTPFGWPQPCASRAAVRWSRANLSQGVLSNCPMILIAGVSVSTGLKSRNGCEASSVPHPGSGPSATEGLA